MNVYLVVLVLKPTQKEVFDMGAVATILGGDAHAVIADSETQAAAKAMRAIADEIEARIARGNSSGREAA